MILECGLLFWATLYMSTETTEISVCHMRTHRWDGKNKLRIFSQNNTRWAEYTLKQVFQPL